MMKPEYKQRVQENLEAINKRIAVVHEMMEGQRPANQNEAIKMMVDVQRLIEQTTNIVDLS